MYNNSNELYHYGVLGMKWGRRRQSRELNPNVNVTKKKQYSEDHRVATELKQKPINQLSNAELRKVNERVNLEKQYKNLNPKGISKGIKYVVGVTALMGSVVGAYNNYDSFVKLGSKFLKGGK